MLSGCGGGGGGGDSGGPVNPTPIARNVLPITVDRGPAPVANINIPYVSVTICAPGGSTVCQTIDHVLFDTASTGLRVLASVLDPSIPLPPQTDESNNNLAECVAFVDGYAWGAVRLADVRLGSDTATAIPIQIIADAAFPAAPTSCSSRGAEAINTVESLGANGVLGASSFVEDCGSVCAQNVIPGTYYVCTGGGCTPVVASLDRQVRNPVAALATDNNGFVVEIAAVPSGGAATASGTLTLGIGTQDNNGLGSAIAYDLDALGELKTIFRNRVLAAFFDSGSNALFFPDTTIPVCGDSSAASGFYCPSAVQDLAAVVQGANNGMTGNVGFSVANATTLITNAPTFTAFGNIAAPSSWAAVFDWGLPFFYGRRVFMAIEQRSTPAGVGPFIAY
jgi:hypothetical protein